MKRNEFLERDGLVQTSNGFEWFIDKSSTLYAQKENLNGIALKNIVCYVVRDMKTGDYERVVVDNKKGEAIYSSSGLEEIGVFIDKIKLLKHFK